MRFTAIAAQDALKFVRSGVMMRLLARSMPMCLSGRLHRCAMFASWLAALAVGCGSSDGPESTEPTACVAPAPPEEAMRQAGPTTGAQTILPGGRMLAPAGTQVQVGGFPVDVLVHPALPVAYVANTGYSLRSIQVIGTASGEIMQDLVRNDAFFGLALDAVHARLYAAGGRASVVDVYDIGADGRLTASLQIPVSGYPAGLALSADGGLLYVGRFTGKALDVVDTSTLAVQAEIALPFGPYGVTLLPARNEVWVTGYADHRIGVVDLASKTLRATVDTAGNPLGLVASPDEKTVYATVADGDVVIAVDAATTSIARSRIVGDETIADEAGRPLPATSPSGIALDPASNRLFVVRAADNAIALYDAATLGPLGAVPVGWYPTAVAILPGGSGFVATNGKGVGTGPLLSYQYGDETGKQQMTGTVSIVDLNSVDLASVTQRVQDAVVRPSGAYPFDCDGVFPVPARPGRPTPIEHIVLIVRENKTYDALFGDLEQGDNDPSLVMYGDDITPNIHALARQFAHHDNFYDDGETSVQGHLWLTSSFVNDYMERIWLEDYRGNGDFGKEAAFEQGQPDFGTFFTHLIRHHLSFMNFGEVTGSLGQVDGETVLSHTDMKFPGIFFNTSIKDEIKAAHVAAQLLDEGPFPAFSYVLLPNDHTQGTSPGSLTPEAMINDNDYATGLLVDRISHSPYWSSTAIFIVEDDPQIGADHVEYHRSICVVASPWVKRGYVSRVHTSIPSLFRTFELILGLPPMNRYDALATPMFDVFTMDRDDTPFDAIPRTVPDEYNGPDATGAEWSARMDFRGPDRNPDLGAVLWWHRMGAPPPGSRIDKVLRGELAFPLGEDSLDEEDEREREIYDQSRASVERWLAEHPEGKGDGRGRQRARDAQRATGP